MAKVRSLFNPVAVETAKRRRICHHNRKQHVILAGQKCLVIKDASTGSAKNYCVPCAAEILSRAGAELADLCRDLGVADS